MSTPSHVKVTPPKPRGQGRHALAVWGTIVLICAAALTGTYLLFVKAPPPNKIVIATGGQAGAYYQFAQKYADELKKEGLTLEVRETNGSVENLHLLEDDASGVSVAIVQSGVAGPEDREKLQALGSLYREPLWVFYRGEPTLDRMSQLAGKRIGVGPPGSGTNAVAVQLLAANGLPEAADGPTPASKTTLVPDKVADAANALRKGDLDAAFFVAAFQTDAIQQLLKDDQIHLLSFGQQEAYHRKYRFLSELTVPMGLVNLGQNLPSKTVSLVAPTAVLVAAQGLAPGPGPAAAHGGHARPRPRRRAFRPRRVPFRLVHRRARRSGRRDFLQVRPARVAAVFALLAGVAGQPPHGHARAAGDAVAAAVPGGAAAGARRTRRKIYLWYSALRDIDKKIALGLTGAQLDQELTRLREINRQVAFVEVPLSYMAEFYHLRLHLKMLQEQLDRMRVSAGDGGNGKAITADSRWRPDSQQSDWRRRPKENVALAVFESLFQKGSTSRDREGAGEPSSLPHGRGSSILTPSGTDSE